MVKDLIKTFVETLVISVGIILLMKFIGYVPPNPRIFNMVDPITFTHFFDNRIYDDWLMIAFLFAIGCTVVDYVREKEKRDKRLHM
ncbi:hypothetical protein QUH70_10385 [Staphylococcus felis]|uniref:hypothetical protein n=1 Tax=Staphylococcus felis TaxID=46127 RepID=UPI001E2FFE61|nr:hypothetical protein [Staphylococcus felis]MDM8328542.1 hypothetical protein [Staphylococcus felis]